MIEDVEACKIQPGDIIWVENHDRLTRRPPLEAIEQFIRFLNAGIILDINGHSRTRDILNQPSGFGLLVQDLIEMFRAQQSHSANPKWGRTRTPGSAKTRGPARVSSSDIVATRGGEPFLCLWRKGTYTRSSRTRMALGGDSRRALEIADGGHGVTVIAKRFNDGGSLPSNSPTVCPKSPSDNLIDNALESGRAGASGYQPLVAISQPRPCCTHPAAVQLVIHRRSWPAYVPGRRAVSQRNKEGLWQT